MVGALFTGPGGNLQDFRPEASGTRKDVSGFGKINWRDAIVLWVALVDTNSVDLAGGY